MIRNWVKFGQVMSSCIKLCTVESSGVQLCSVESSCVHSWIKLCPQLNQVVSSSFWSVISKMTFQNSIKFLNLSVPQFPWERPEGIIKKGCLKLT